MDEWKEMSYHVWKYKSTKERLIDEYCDRDYENEIDIDEIVMEDSKENK